MPSIGSLGDDIDLTDASPRIITSACGTLAVSGLPTSTDRRAPTPLLEGQLARGRIDPAIAANTAHFWTIELQPGYHHLFVDSRRIDGNDSNLGLNVEEIGPDGETREQLLRGYEIGYRARTAEFFVNGEPRTLTLRVTPNFAAEDYVIGFFANGRSIPSPYFEDCPTIEALSLGTTVATRLATVDAAEDTRWYRIDLDEGAYVYDSLAVRVDGADSNIIYDFKTLEGFGALASEERVLRINAIDTITRDRATFDRAVTAPIWLRLQNELRDGAAIDVEFTLTRQGG